MQAKQDVEKELLENVSTFARNYAIKAIENLQFQLTTVRSPAKRRRIEWKVEHWGTILRNLDELKNGEELQNGDNTEVPNS